MMGMYTNAASALPSAADGTGELVEVAVGSGESVDVADGTGELVEVAVGVDSGVLVGVASGVLVDVASPLSPPEPSGSTSIKEASSL